MQDVTTKGALPLPQNNGNFTVCIFSGCGADSSIFVAPIEEMNSSGPIYESLRQDGIGYVEIGDIPFRFLRKLTILGSYIEETLRTITDIAIQRMEICMTGGDDAFEDYGPDCAEQVQQLLSLFPCGQKIWEGFLLKLEQSIESREQEDFENGVFEEGYYDTYREILGWKLYVIA